MLAASSEKFKKKASIPFLEKEARSAWAVQSRGSETTIAICIRRILAGKYITVALSEIRLLEKSVL
jgi:hypothetical protein